MIARVEFNVAFAEQCPIPTLGSVVANANELLAQFYPNNPAKGITRFFTENPADNAFKLIRGTFETSDGTSTAFIEKAGVRLKVARGYDMYRNYIHVNLLNIFSPDRNHSVWVQNGYGTEHTATDEEIAEYDQFLKDLKDNNVEFVVDPSAHHWRMLTAGI